jgi:uncharacterized protein YabN with tetrapyrrole methylase and pyrophosphatase domain
MDKLYQKVQTIVLNNYVHRKGFFLANMTLDTIIDHLLDEVYELEEAYKFKSMTAMKDEMGDVLAILYHIMFLQNWSVEEIEKLACEKLDERFNLNEKENKDN